MTDRDDKPSGWRLLAGFLLAPMPPVLLGSAVFPAYDGLKHLWLRILMTFPWALIFCGYVPALFVGLPTYAFLRRRLRLTMLNCILAGAFVAALPFGLIAAFPIAESASTNGEPTIVYGRLTWFGITENLKMVGMLAAFGALGGGVFRLVVAGPPSRHREVAET